MAAAAMGLAACQPATGPTIERVEPAAAARGTRIVVMGDEFCGEGRDGGDGTCTSLPPGAVDVGLDLPMARAMVVTWGAQEIMVNVPAAAATGASEIIVTVDGRSSNAAAFEVLP
jgi:hypothetical protein